MRHGSFVLLLALMAGCASPNTASSAAGTAIPGAPLVLATTTLFADMAANVGGNRMRVESIVPAGAHVEEYEPRPEDSRKVAEASLFIENGLDLDKWSEPLLRDKKRDAVVVTLTDGLSTIENDNPHMWFDAQLARKYVEKIRDALVVLDPSSKVYFTDRASAYDGELVKLDEEVRAQIATIPAANRKLVTSHDQFPYFAKAYGMEVVGFAQIEPGKDPTPAELGELVRRVRAAGVPAIFVEAGFSDAISRTLASEAGVKKIVIDMPTDSIGAPPADSYIGVMRTVAKKISEALR